MPRASHGNGPLDWPATRRSGVYSAGSGRILRELQSCSPMLAVHNRKDLRPACDPRLFLRPAVLTLALAAALLGGALAPVGRSCRGRADGRLAARDPAPAHAAGVGTAAVGRGAGRRAGQRERARAGLAPLARSAELAAEAGDYAASMADGGIFSHVALDGSGIQQRGLAHGYLGWTFLGENLAAGQDTPERVCGLDGQPDPPRQRPGAPGLRRRRRPGDLDDDPLRRLLGDGGRLRAALGRVDCPGAERAVTEVVLPVLGLTMSEGTIVRWLKAVGQAVSKDEPLLVVETDKAATEVLSPADGVVVELLAAEGSVVPVQAVIARLVPSSSGNRARHSPPLANPGPRPHPSFNVQPSTFDPLWLLDTMLRIRAFDERGVMRENVVATPTSSILAKIAPGALS